MTSILDLIHEHCPNGVEHIPLEQAFDIRGGYTPSKRNLDYWENGTIPWYRMEDVRTNGRILSDSIQKVTPLAVKGKGLFPGNLDQPQPDCDIPERTRSYPDVEDLIREIYGDNE